MPRLKRYYDSLIDPSGLAGEIQELKGGQIFCSCLSGSFVESVVAYQEVTPDLLIVECSGLAKPSSMKDITRAIDLEAPGAFDCAGMVCLVDGVSHLDLENTLMVLTEQMEASDQGPLFFDGTSAGIRTCPPPRQMEPGLVVITDDPSLRFELGFL